MATACPYCREEKSDAGLRGHIMIQNDDQHGPLGRLPDDSVLTLKEENWEALKTTIETEASDAETDMVAQLRNIL